jgi:NAD-dependent SIR2 family protein deacetylase
MTKEKNNSSNLSQVAGYDFVCINEDCQYCNTRITLSEPWPITSIHDMLEIKDLPDEHVAFLQSQIDDGRKYALIVYPNKHNLKQIGWRHQFYCPECYVIWEEEVVFDEKKEALTHCKRCNSKVKNIEDIVEDGIICPSCQKPLEKKSWITKLS